MGSHGGNPGELPRSPGITREPLGTHGILIFLRSKASRRTKGGFCHVCWFIKGRPYLFDNIDRTPQEPGRSGARFWGGRGLETSQNAPRRPQGAPKTAPKRFQKPQTLRRLSQTLQKAPRRLPKASHEAPKTPTWLLKSENIDVKTMPICHPFLASFFDRFWFHFGFILRPSNPFKSSPRCRE